MSTFEEQVKALGEKISQGLREDPAPPKTQMSFGFWLADRLSLEEFRVLDKIEDEFGAIGANNWLVDVMASSGKYNADGEFVSAVA